MALWLAWSVYCVNVEPMDGYGAIVNAQHFLGITEGYFWQRTPAVAWMLMPAEYTAHRLGLHPLDVRIHHAFFALIHALYLLGSWVLLERHFGARASTLAAYVAAVPCFVFFSYAPFISHDLFPGALTLLMFVLAARYSRKPRKSTLAALALLGSGLALVKQTYAVVWPALLIASAIVMYLPGAPSVDRRRHLAFLALSACASGAITWIALSWSLGNSFPETAWWLRPIEQAARVVAHVDSGAPDTDGFDRWLYLRNLAAYGVLAMTLVLPGVCISLWRGSALQRTVAIGWLLLVTAMSIIEYKEVRYLAFLAPMTAFLLVPAIEAAIAFRRAYASILLLIWVFDLSGIVGEASRLRHPFYRETLVNFFRPLPATAATAQFVMDVPLSFVSPERFAFSRDRYHRIFSINGDQIYLLFGYPRSALISGLREEQLDEPWVQPGSVLFIANDMATRRPPFRADNLPWRRDGFSQLAAVAERVDLQLEGDRYQLVQQTTQPVIVFRKNGSQAQPMTSTSSFGASEMQALLGLDSTPEHVSVLGFRIREYCSADGCSSL